MTDKNLNRWLKFKSYLRFLFRIKPRKIIPIDLSGYKLNFYDPFSGDELNSEKWMIGQPWGEYHPESPYQYYGKSKKFVDVGDGYLNLYSRYEPRTFYDEGTSKYIDIPYGVGLVVSRQDFKYGYYEIGARLPVGKMLWPAIWLTAVKSWPPEIDILEGYSGEESKYWNEFGIKNFKIQPNIHYGYTYNDTKSSYGAISYPLYKATDRDTIYSLYWTEDFIKIYYDRYLVFQTTDKNILDYFNGDDVTMYIILNNAYVPEVKFEKYDPSCFKINYVKYFKKK